MRPISLLFQVQSLVTRPYQEAIMSNVYRSAYVETIVSVALAEDGWRRLGHWDAWDLEHPSGCRLDVRQAAAAQIGNHRRRKSQPQFVIKARTRRQAHIYVFAWHPTPDDTADHRNPSEWEFYVVAEPELPDLKSIGLGPLRRMTEPCSVHDLRATVDSTRERLAMTAGQE